MADVSEKKPEKIYHDFKEVLQRCCDLENTLLKNVHLLNCIKNKEEFAMEQLEKSEKDFETVRKSTETLKCEIDENDVESERLIDRKNLRQRLENTQKLYEKSKAVFQQLLQEIEPENCPKSCNDNI